MATKKLILKIEGNDLVLINGGLRIGAETKIKHSASGVIFRQISDGPVTDCVVVGVACSSTRGSSWRGGSTSGLLSGFGWRAPSSPRQISRAPLMGICHRDPLRSCSAQISEKGADVARVLARPACARLPSALQRGFSFSVTFYLCFAPDRTSSAPVRGALLLVQGLLDRAAVH